MGTVRFRRVNLRLLVVLAIIAIMATAAYGFAATNTINDGGTAGDGSGTVSGFTVTNVQYSMDNSSPANITGVSFTLSPAANNASARFGDGSNNYTKSYSCVPVTGETAPASDWTCGVPAVDGVTVLSVNQLGVAAVK